MTSGATLYLVSACGTAEEFVVAFRRYTDRTGLFVPTTTPLPAGRRGRLALTLKDGGVMIEGDAEILQSSAKPTVLHGRPGMTVKFVEPDELSKTVISDLEKARLALKPTAPSAPPRPADVPAEPRPTVPPIGGRIDAANALAECVVIGDASALAETTKAAPGKLAVPAIPAAPARPKQPTAPPDVSRSKPTSIGFPIIEKPPASALKVTPAVVQEEPTAIGLAAPKPDGAPRAARTFETQPVGTVRPPLVPDSSSRSGPASPLPRGKNATRPPLTPRHPTPVAPVPIVRPPAKRAPAVDDSIVERAIVEEEKTDLSDIPQPSAPVQAAPVVDAASEPTAPLTPLDVAPPADKKQRSGGMRASEIMAAIPEGDWTMAPDAAAPTALPAEKPAPPKGPPTGNWSISLDPETGWSEPKKIEAPPAPPPPKAKPRAATSGNPDIAVAKDEGFDAVAWEDKPTHIGEKIEIDSTLMEAPVAPAPPPAMPPPLAANLAAQYAPPAPPAPHPPAGTGSYGSLPPQTAVMRARSSNRTVYVLAGVAAVAVAAVLAFALSRGSSKAPPAAKVVTPTAPIDAAPVAVAAPDAAVEQVETQPEAPVETPAAKTTCSTKVTSLPTGADVYQGDSKLGTTPATLELPCGVEAKLTLKKAKFSPTPRAFTPADGKANKVSVKLVKPTFAVKVTSTPPGATITVGRKSMGVTPASIRLPAYEATSVVLSKPGYVTDTRTLTPKTNNTLHSVTLKKGRR